MQLDDKMSKAESHQLDLAELFVSGVELERTKKKYEARYLSNDPDERGPAPKRLRKVYRLQDKLNRVVSKVIEEDPTGKTPEPEERLDNDNK